MGTVALMMERRPAPIYSEEYAKKQKGIAIFIRLTIAIIFQLDLNSLNLFRSKTTGNRTMRPLRTLISIKKTGPNSGVANRKNRNEDPQIAERIINSKNAFKLTLCINS